MASNMQKIWRNPNTRLARHFHVNGAASAPKVTVSVQNTNGKKGTPDLTAFPLPGNTSTLYKYKLSKMPEISTPESKELTDKLLTEPTPKQMQFETLRTFGEQDQQERQNSLSLTKDTAGMHFKIADAPALAKKEFLDLFPARVAEMSAKPLTLVSMASPTEHDMSAWSPKMEAERDVKTKQVIDVGVDVCEALRAEGFWADFIDPASGRPYLGPFTSATLFETDGRYRHMGMRVEDLGCCKVIMHPEYGTHAFVSALFTDAPADHPVLRQLRQ